MCVYFHTSTALVHAPQHSTRLVRRHRSGQSLQIFEPALILSCRASAATRCRVGVLRIQTIRRPVQHMLRSAAVISDYQLLDDILPYWVWHRCVSPGGSRRLCCQSVVSASATMPEQEKGRCSCQASQQCSAQVAEGILSYSCTSPFPYEWLSKQCCLEDFQAVLLQGLMSTPD